ncbi:MAG: tRNA 2-thiouridine(34) synthase MnmA [Deltaproteobacteria bacterium]|nr:tRNA 2-thiouridine(34) synthase MnmA [Deltaproteobacteria bacterium]
MSGGVDSSVAAVLLKEKGFDVIGVNLKLWDSGRLGDEEADARGVCKSINTPFHVFDLREDFKKKVVEPFVNEYGRGRTPNPCVVCNRQIKFGLLLEEAKRLGADYLATGHYVRIMVDNHGDPHLLKGRDDEKDQSYVLGHLTGDVLKKVIFPVGEYTKSEIRGIAERHHLPVSQKRESMDICFIPDHDHAGFIARHFPQKKFGEGFFVDQDNRVLGKHQGVDRYTIGQRKKLGISSVQRLYVAALRPETNEVVLAAEECLYDKGVIGEDFHFLYAPKTSECGVKLRYQKNEIPAMISGYDEKKAEITLFFREKARAVTPGQALVLYDGDEVIGGGWIRQAVK